MRKISKEEIKHIVNNEEEVIRKQLNEEKLSQAQTINLLIQQLANSNFLLLMNIIDKLIFAD